MDSSCTSGGSGWTAGGNFSLKRWLTIERSCPAGWGSPCSWSAQELTGHGTWCYGLVERLVVGQRLDLMIFKVFSNLNEPVNLFYESVILLPIPVFQLRALVHRDELVLACKTEAKKTWNTSDFSSPFVTISSCIQQRWRFYLASFCCWCIYRNIFFCLLWQ